MRTYTPHEVRSIVMEVTGAILQRLSEARDVVLDALDEPKPPEDHMRDLRAVVEALASPGENPSGGE